MEAAFISPVAIRYNQSRCSYRGGAIFDPRPSSAEYGFSSPQQLLSLSSRPACRIASTMYGCSTRNKLPYKISKIECSTNVASEPLVFKYNSMKETYHALAQRLLPVALETKLDDKYIIGIAGPPGAGKSTLAKEVAAELNRQYRERMAIEKASNVGDVAIAVPMDGFHLYRSQLDAMEDPVEAHARRGAPWTFNPTSLYICLNTLRTMGWAYFPSFDHGVGDPIEQDIEVSVKHRVVLVEGNYLLLDHDWEKIRQLFDERWFISVDLDTAMKRVVRRHISTGKTKEAAIQRVDYNDRPNAELIQQTMNRADVVIHSVELQSVEHTST